MLVGRCWRVNPLAVALCIRPRRNEHGSGDQGKREEARELLAPVYGWFTEGFDTADLRGAKAQLDALA